MAQIILPGGRIENQIVEKVHVIDQAKRQVDESTIRKIGCYKCVATKTQGIYRIIEGKTGFIVKLDYGYVEKKGKKKRVRTTKRVDTFEEAYALKVNTSSEKVDGYRKGFTLEDAIEAYKKSTRYIDRLSEGQQNAYDNYFRHAIDGMGGLEPKEITVTRMEEYFKYLLTEGRRGTRKKNDGGPPEGISVNSISKHKSCLKALWEFIILDKKYGVRENVAAIAETPMIDIVDEEGRTVKVKRIEQNFETLTLDEVNDTLNDILQNEFDRSIAFAFGLGMICGLRRGEILGLKLGRYYHDEMMAANIDSICNSKSSRLAIDTEYYKEHDELFIVDGQIKRVKGAIVKYQLELEDGSRIDMTVKEIKNEMHLNNYKFINLQIDKAGRLVDKAIPSKKPSSKPAEYTVEDLIKGVDPKDRPVQFEFDDKVFNGIGVGFCSGFSLYDDGRVEYHTHNDETIDNIILVYVKELGGNVEVRVDFGDYREDFEACDTIYEEAIEAYREYTHESVRENVEAALRFYKENKDKYRIHLGHAFDDEIYITDCEANPYGRYSVVAIATDIDAFKVRNEYEGEEIWVLGKLSIDECYDGNENEYCNVEIVRNEVKILGPYQKVEFAATKEKMDLLEQKLHEFVDLKIEKDYIEITDYYDVFKALTDREQKALRSLAKKYDSIYGEGSFEYEYKCYINKKCDADGVYYAEITDSDNKIKLISKNEDKVQDWINIWGANIIKNYKDNIDDKDECSIDSVIEMIGTDYEDYLNEHSIKYAMRKIYTNVENAEDYLRYYLI